jgi:hypothetical protein
MKTMREEFLGIALKSLDSPGRGGTTQKVYVSDDPAVGLASEAWS